jgi:hypothetical protein
MRMVHWKNVRCTLLYDWMISGGCGDLVREIASIFCENLATTKKGCWVSCLNPTYDNGG